MAKRRRPRPGNKAGWIIGVVVVVMIALLATGVGVAGTIYFLTRPGVLPVMAPGASLPGVATPTSGFAYANSPDGLEKEVSDLVADRQAGKDARIKEAVNLPGKWFEDAFGETQGKELYAKYTAGPQTPGQMLQSQIDQALRFGVTKIQARVMDRRFTDPVNQKAFAAMLPKASPVYTAELQNPPGTGFQAYIKDQSPSAPSGSSVGVQDFVYVDGAFRFFCPNLIWPR